MDQTSSTLVEETTASFDQQLNLSTSDISDLIDSGLQCGKEGLPAGVVRNVSFLSEATTKTTSSERQFRQDLASLDAEIARLQLQFRVAASK